MKLGKIADKLGCSLEGDPEVEIDGVAGIEDAGPGQITFLNNPRYSARALETKAAAILVAEPLDGCRAAALISEDPYLDFARALAFFYQPPRTAPGVHPTAVVAESASIGSEASIGPYAVVGDNVEIGARAVLHPHVTIYSGVKIGDDFEAHAHSVVREACRVGDRVLLQNGVVVGGDGYGFARRADGTHHKIPQSGIVVVEDDVEIQAGSCIDRAAVGETRIGAGSKIDNLVQIGHAVHVGTNTILCAQVGIAGSTSLGDNCVLAGQVGLVNHLKVGDNVLITAQSGVAHDITDNSKVSGYPAQDNRQWLRCTAVHNRLPELDRAVRRLRKRAEEKDD